MSSLLTLYESFWHPTLQVCTAMERRGVRLDVAAIEEAKERAVADQAVALQSTLTWVGRHTDALEWSPTSTKDVPEFLYDTLGWPVPPVTGGLSAIKRAQPGKRSTSEAALAWLLANVVKDPGDRAGLQALQAYRKITKQIQFLTALPAALSSDGRLRSSFAPNAETGRLASSKPNLQNISSTKDAYGIRRAFVPKPGHVLLVFDFKALEIYVMAHYLRQYYTDDSLYDALKSGDVYAAQAVRTWPEHLSGVAPGELKKHPDANIRKWRKPAKELVLGTNYGKTPGGIALQLGVPDDVGREYYDAYFRANPGIARFQADSLALAAEHGFVRTLLGRLRYIPVPKDATRGARASAGRKATNTRVQGSGADWMYGCMLACNTDVDVGVGPGDKDFGWFSAELAALDCQLVLQVHDELVFEVPEVHAPQAFEIVKARMLQPFPKLRLLVDLEVDGKIVERWSDAK